MKKIKKIKWKYKKVKKWYFIVEKKFKIIIYIIVLIQNFKKY